MLFVVPISFGAFIAAIYVGLLLALGYAVCAWLGGVLKPLAPLFLCAVYLWLVYEAPIPLTALTLGFLAIWGAVLGIAQLGKALERQADRRAERARIARTFGRLSW